jgi:PAS domain-containing protein
VTDILGGLAIVVALHAAAIVALLFERSRRAQAERGLRESEERFRLMADRAPVMMWTARPDTTLDFLNRTCVEFTGLQPEQLMDEGWLKLVHPKDLDHCVVFIRGLRLLDPSGAHIS